MDQQDVEQLEAEESMFVQTARRITSSGATITLHDVTLATLASPIGPSGSRTHDEG
jgi:hypothetical protein